MRSVGPRSVTSPGYAGPIISVAHSWRVMNSLSLARTPSRLPITSSPSWRAIACILMMATIFMAPGSGGPRIAIGDIRSRPSSWLASNCITSWCRWKTRSLVALYATAIQLMRLFKMRNVFWSGCLWVVCKVVVFQRIYGIDTLAPIQLKELREQRYRSWPVPVTTLAA